MSKDKSGSAFPMPHPTDYYAESGLTKREYFAAMALQGFTANTHSIKWLPEEIAKDAVTHADALIAELAK